MVITTPFLPRIYYLTPQLTGSLDEYTSHLKRCAEMGFDHVLISGVSAGPEHAAKSGTLSEADIGNLVKACRAQRLQLLLDLNVGSVALDSALLQTQASWFARPSREDDLPDPRRAVCTHTKALFRYDDPGIAEEILIYWQQRLQAWLDAGVAGFRCVELNHPPASIWQRLVTHGRSRQSAARFLAWTPGCTAEQVQALAGCGFDATFSSGAWWDYRSRWLIDEQMRLARVAPAIAFPDSPDEPVIARMSATENLDARRNIYLRALRLAAAGGNGILVPMGFEFGLGVNDSFNSRRAGFDLSSEIRQANAFIAEAGPRFYAAPLQLLSATDARLAMLMRHAAKVKEGDEALLIVASADTAQSCPVTQRQLQERAMDLVPDRRIWPEQPLDVSPTHALELQPAELQVFAARRTAPILLPAARGKQTVVTAARSPRIAIEAISPSIDAGRFPVKRTLGESVNIEADVFTDGHDKLAVALLWRTADDPNWQEVRMHAIGNDRWLASLPLTRLGRYLFTIEAWRDNFATYRDELEKKASAGLDVALELEEGRLMVEAAAAYAEENQIDAAADLKALAKALKVPQQRGKIKASPNDPERIAALLSEPTLDAMRAADARPFAVRSEPVLRIDAERPQARFSSWYELFPRSQSGDPKRHGTFDDVITRLPAIQAMGFDTLYFTPIHPIGKKHRKGKNNSLNAGPDEPGSPYAIGSEEGGHDAIHPELGTIEDFRRLRDEAARHGLELALDFAIQCSPDHPWLKEHPDWFNWRPDGTIRYAENPPKKYQDIVNVDFYADGAIPGLWIALRDAVLFWVKEGVRVFRVDNPHTKPLPFWEWMINDIRGRYPDTIFLSEAFTRPKMMYRLAKVGYSQSYTYFTWRHTKAEFIDYLTELTTTNVREYFRPHFFVNTPDINPYFLQRSGRPGFLIRAALATTLSGLWGMYSGFELCEGTPVPGKEEYLDSEKYEIRAWDWQRPGNIIHEITALNHIRIENPALQSHLGIRFLPASNDNILFFLKSTEPANSSRRFGDNVVLVAINLDPFAAHEAMLELPLWEFGVPDDGMLEVDDLVGGGRSMWQGRQRHVRLDPFANPYAIWRVRHQ